MANTDSTTQTFDHIAGIANSAKAVLLTALDADGLQQEALLGAADELLAKIRDLAESARDA